jgi:hypothetical protein
MSIFGRHDNITSVLRVIRPAPVISNGCERSPFAPLSSNPTSNYRLRLRTEMSLFGRHDNKLPFDIHNLPSLSSRTHVRDLHSRLSFPALHQTIVFGSVLRCLSSVDMTINISSTRNRPAPVISNGCERSPFAPLSSNPTSNYRLRLRTEMSLFGRHDNKLPFDIHNLPSLSSRTHVRDLHSRLSFPALHQTIVFGSVLRCLSSVDMTVIVSSVHNTTSLCHLERM